MVLILPGVPAPSGASSIDMAVLRPSSQPLGGVRRLLDRLTGSYTDNELTAIRRVWALLEASVPLSLLDTLSFKMANQADSLLNWLGDGSAVNHGAAFGALGFTLDGIDDFIDPRFDLSGSGSLRAHNGSVGAYLTHDGGSPVLPLLGVPSATGGNTSHLHPRHGTGTRFRLASASTHIISLVRPDVRGLWHMGNSSEGTYLFFGADSTSRAEVPSTTLPNVFNIGMNNTNFAAISVSGWFSGNYLNAPRRQALTRAFEIMKATFVQT